MQRKNLWRRDRCERDQWLLDKLDEFSVTGRKGSHFHVSGQKMCRTTWLQIYGINKNTFYRVKKQWKEGSVTINNTHEKKKSIQRMEAAAWFGTYLKTVGENPPHVTEIWLPYRSRKKDVYQEYKDDMITNDQPFCSYQTFLNMWVECYSNVKARKVSIYAHDPCIQLLKYNFYISV